MHTSSDTDAPMSWHTLQCNLEYAAVSSFAHYYRKWLQCWWQRSPPSHRNSQTCYTRPLYSNRLSSFIQKTSVVYPDGSCPQRTHGETGCNQTHAGSRSPGRGRTRRRADDLLRAAVHGVDAPRVCEEGDAAQRAHRVNDQQRAVRMAQVAQARQVLMRARAAVALPPRQAARQAALPRSLLAWRAAWRARVPLALVALRLGTPVPVPRLQQALSWGGQGNRLALRQCTGATPGACCLRCSLRCREHVPHACHAQCPTLHTAQTASL